MDSEQFSSTYKNLGLKVLYYRKLNGLTQKELAKRAGLTCSQVSYIERGKGSCKVNSLFSIAKALNLNVSVLFN